MTSSWRNFRFLLFSQMSTYPPTFRTTEHTLICVLKKSRFWWRHHDVTHFKKKWVCTYHLTNIIQKKFWNYHVSFARYGNTVKNMHNSYKITWWRHHHVTLIFVYNTSRNTCIPRSNQVRPTVPEIRGPKVCTFSVTSRDLGWKKTCVNLWRCTFKMTSRVTWWCHHNKIIWQTSRDGHLNVRQAGSRSEMEKSQSAAWK